MNWDSDRKVQLRTLAQQGLHDREIAARLGTSLKAVEMARYRAGIPSYRRCIACAEVAPVAAGSTRKLRLCAACLELAAARYLASQQHVALLAQTLGTSPRTLQVEAQRTYGMTRRDVSPALRYQIREVLRGHRR